MEPDPTEPLYPPYEEGDTDDKDPTKGQVEPGWWALVGGVWRWVTDPLPRM
jgi:hypothetical protein